MASVNKVILVGNLGKDPELRYTTSGMAVASFSLATSSGGGRDREPTTEWHKIVVFDKQAELCNQYLAKGRQVYLEGRLQTRSYDDKQTGQKRFVTEIVANQVVFLGGGADRSGAERGSTERGGSDRSSERPRQQSRSADPYAEPQGNWQGANKGSSRSGGYDEAPEGDDLPPSTFSDDDDIPF